MRTTSPQVTPKSAIFSPNLFVLVAALLVLLPSIHGGQSSSSLTAGHVIYPRPFDASRCVQESDDITKNAQTLLHQNSHKYRRHSVFQYGASRKKNTKSLWSVVSRGGSSDSGKSSGTLGNLLKRILRYILGGSSGQKRKKGGKQQKQYKRKSKETSAVVSPFSLAFDEAVSEVDSSREDLEYKPESMENTSIARGHLSRALKMAQIEGKPLLVIVLGAVEASRSHVEKDSLDSKLWAAITDGRCVKALREKVVVWGVWSGSQEAIKASKLLKVEEVKTGSGKGRLVALLRPAQGAPGTLTAPSSNSFSILGKYPGLLINRRGKSNSPVVSAARLAAWITSTLSRYQNELKDDAKLASDRAIVHEVAQDFKSGLQKDIEQEERLRREEEAAAAEAAAEAKRVKAEADAVEAEKKRRQALRDALRPEPSIQDAANGAKGDEASVCSIAVRLLDGTRQRRRFFADCTVGEIFDWLDGHFEVDTSTTRLRVPEASKGGSSSSDIGNFVCEGRGDAPVIGGHLRLMDFMSALCFSWPKKLL